MGKLGDAFHAAVFIIMVPVVMLVALVCDRCFGIRRYLRRGKQ